ncbi:esterase family protein [Rhodococcus erythropolis]|uniref:Esterase n=1 Tax=Rhodococcus erythropolis TaxID=1833 RepID=A0A5N5EAF3_RHOER|nr:MULTISPECIES: alpha/beta hydrolase family protein [Rhodococcus]ERB53637.1 esterase [Rhodococcus sp. P27]AGT91635.1 mycolyltransferase [Rhodococcus erythropolis CCM2595]KAB2586222.1 esterase [Rhodococcus erythropolis]MCJ0948380.1 esterase family protein [Rhodococcus sp. ARC_M8]MCS4254466.1 S-formylglutathione hydrolase FrmB [Rhodococcus erythropolis]
MAASVVLVSSSMGIAGATPIAHQGGGDAAQDDSDGSYIESVERVNDRQIVVNVYAASMDKSVPIQVILPADNSQPRPILYLLNGADGGEGTATWDRQTDVVDFFADKNVNVAIPAKGLMSYYTDWEKEDSVLGKNMWSTFLGKELPPLLNKELGSNGDQSIAAISMSATSVLNLAIEYPGFYKSVASYSGCAQTSDPMGQAFVRATTEWIGGVGDIQNMWGPFDGPGWVEHDPVVNAEKLRGTPLYISTGSGLPGFPNDTPENPRIQDGRAAMFDQIVVGGPIEFATSICTGNLARRLADLNIPATVDFRPVGTHSWGYWQDDLHKSWPFIAQSLGV